MGFLSPLQPRAKDNSTTANTVVLYILPTSCVYGLVFIGQLPEETPVYSSVIENQSHNDACILIYHIKYVYCVLITLY